MLTSPIRRVRTVILDGAGAGMVTFGLGEIRVGQRWKIQRMLVQIAGEVAGNPNASIYVYLGIPEASNLLDGSDIGGFNVSELPNPLTMEAGDYLTFAWAAGTPGALATGMIEGMMEQGV